MDPSAQLYAGTATVLESKDHGPQLCLRINPSVPRPSCRGVPVSNWRWDQVKDEKSKDGTTWGAYSVVGTYDGGTFRLTARPDTPRPSTRLYPDEPLVTPCSPPGEGWRPVDAGRTHAQAMAAAVAVARQAPGFAGVWIVNAGAVDQVLNVAFTTDLDRREVELRQIWGGALCVVRHEWTLRELQGIQGEFSDLKGAPFGLHLLAVGVDESRNHVEVRALLVDNDTRRAIDARFGTGAVRFLAELVPTP